MYWQNEFTKIITENCSDLLSQYNKVYTWFQKGFIEEEVWDNFCFGCVKELMKKSNKVLDKLKNM